MNNAAEVTRRYTRAQHAARWVKRALVELRTLFSGHDELISIVVWAALIGIAGALASVVFRLSIRGFQWLLTGHAGSLVLVATELSPPIRALSPALGGIVAGIILEAGRRLSTGRGNVDYMEAVVVGDGRVGARPTIMRSLSSLATIASGGSIGREGPMVQLAALLGSKAGLLSRAPLPRRRLFVACGAAAGIASAYNAPIAGAVFVAEIVMRSFAMESFGPLLVASVSADATIHRFLGFGPVFSVPATHFGENWELALYAALGILLGHLSPPFLALLDASKRSFARRVTFAPLRLAIGGLVVGVVSLAFPQVWGNGYSVVGGILHTEYAAWFLLCILIAKVISTLATAGSGAVGGVFTPTLFIGAAIGSLVGAGLHALSHSLASDSAAFAVVGMGSFLAATTHAPLTAVLMIFEMTLDHAVVLPLILACVTAHYTAKVYRRGASVYNDSLLSHSVAADDLGGRPLSAIMRNTPPQVRDTARVSEALTQVPRHRKQVVYVVNGSGALVASFDAGVLASDVRRGDIGGDVSVLSVATPVRDALTPELSLTDALERFVRSHARSLPVIASPWRATLLGEIARHDLLLALQERLSEKVR